MQAQLERGRGQLQCGEPVAQQHQQVGAVTRRLGKRDIERGDAGRGRVVARTLLVLHQQSEAAHEGEREAA